MTSKVLDGIWSDLVTKRTAVRAVLTNFLLLRDSWLYDVSVTIHATQAYLDPYPSRHFVMDVETIDLIAHRFSLYLIVSSHRKFHFIGIYAIFKQQRRFIVHAKAGGLRRERFCFWKYQEIIAKLCIPILH